MPAEPVAIAPETRAAIDRRALVRRHNPTLHRPEPGSPLTVGNGEFAFTADVTGLQSLDDAGAPVPLCTQAQWGWHRSPRPPAVGAAALRLQAYEVEGRSVALPTDPSGQEPLWGWLRENPHRLHLGRLGFWDGSEGGDLRATELEGVRQTLDVWSGSLQSHWRWRGEPVAVRTAVHPGQDVLAVRVRSPLLADGRLQVRLAFPYGSPAMRAADWTGPERHRTGVRRVPWGGALIARRLDEDGYHAAIAWSPGAVWRADGPHEFLLAAAPGARELDVVCAFSPQPHGAAPPAASQVEAAAAAHWERFWLDGAAVELAASRDPRALELERRVVLSQYQTAVHCAGSLPPQETGLVCNSWYGKFHLEMHWWHASHFPLWGRAALLQRSLGWYQAILPAARAAAAAVGCGGARWPKMTGPEGTESPSPVGPLLIWQQPHPIAYAELCYRAAPSRATLRRYGELVHETAAFLASYPRRDRRGRLVLGPPVIPAQENHPPRTTWNPTFELAYWRHALGIAQRWRQRQGLPREPQWDHVRAHLSALPVAEGVYLAHENCPETFSQRARDHPAMLGALGVLPGCGVDRATMARTLERVLAEWQWEHTWGWDYGLAAMTAARLGAPARAVDALLLPSPKNTYARNGHNWQRPNLPVYLPGNGAVLIAVALMAGGWRGSRGPAPGFPADGTWTVRAEGLRPWL